MKKYILITGLALTALMSSCNDFADELLTSDAPSTIDEAKIFSSPGLAVRAVDGIKISFGETNSYRGRFLPWYGMNTDSEWYNSSESTSNDNANLVNYDTRANNTVMNTPDNTWAKMYEGIEKANICIKGLRTYGNPTPGSELGYLLGESLALRAIFYADLLRAFGDVPARFTPVDKNEIYVPKAKREVIYKQLIADMGEAATLVPYPNGNAATTSVERINKAFVKGLRARLALAASGFQQYPDGIHRTTDPDLSVAKMYALALQECKDVIASGSARLEPTFEGLWRKYNQEITTAGGESLWEIPFADGRGRMQSTFGVLHTVKDQYQQSGTNKGGQDGPLPNVFYDFDEKDQRRDVTCVPYRWGPLVDGKSKQVLGALNRWSFGKFRYEWMNRIVTSANDDGINKIYMRYGEILLMAAEAANELEGPAAGGVYLKMLRRRAFAPADQNLKVDTYVNALGSKQAMFNAIVDEQKYEFTGEMERKMNLIRWNMLGSKMAQAKEKMNNLRLRTGEYATVPSTLYFRYAANNESLIIYGLNRGELTNPSVPQLNYTAFAWDGLTESKVNSLYKANPDAKQFWPIWQVFIDTSNGLLKNDYGY